MISSDYDRILTTSFKILRENNYLPVMIFCTEIQDLYLGRTFLIVNRFSKFLQHILGHSKR